MQLARLKLSAGLVIDPLAENVQLAKNLRCVKNNFPDKVPVGASFDAIIALAVFEHIPIEVQHQTFQIGLNNLFIFRKSLDVKN